MDFIKTKICAYCDKEFTVGYNQRNAKYCCEECAKAVRKIQKKEYEKKIKNKPAPKRTPRPSLPYSGVQPLRIKCRDWRSVVRVCEEYGVSYGYAVAMHLID